MRTGIAHLPLHSGKAPRWLFERMTKLAREITIIIVQEFGPDEILNALAGALLETSKEVKQLKTKKS